MALGPEGAFDSREVYAGAALVRVGDELWLYYVGYDRTHGEAHELPRIRNDLDEDTLFAGAISRAVMRLDGFMSADAPMAGGKLTTPPLVLVGKRLELNMDASAGGEVTVELLGAEGKPIPGYTTEEADALYYNNVRAVAAWKGETDLSPLAGRPVRIHFIMRAAKLYAFQFTG